MSGWVPFDSHRWPEIAAVLPQPWPEGAALFDLRWHVDRSASGRVPRGKRFWMARWGWTDWGVRSLLRSEAWRDPIHPLSAQDPPADHPLSAQDPPAPRRSKRKNRADSAQDPPADHPPTTQDPPADRHTRGDPPSPSPSPSPEGQTSAVPADRSPCGAEIGGRTKPDTPDRFDEVGLFWGQVVHLSLGRRLSNGPERKSKTGQKLLRAVKADPELVLDAMRFVAEGDNDRARFLRGEVADHQGRTFVMTLETLLRHLDEYAELWRARDGPGRRPVARGAEHASLRAPEPTPAELAARDPHLWDPL